MNAKEKVILADCRDGELSLRERCRVLALNRSTYYYSPRPEKEEDLQLMNMIDKQYTRTPFYGSRRLTVWLRRQGYEVNRKRVQRLMEKMGIHAIYPMVNMSQPAKGHKLFPYLLRGVEIVRPNQVWSADITYLRMAQGFLYLVAVMDWYSRYVLAWKLSNTMDVGFCLEALGEALQRGHPEIFNSDQGSQFTSDDFTRLLLDREIQVSMDGRGRALDNIFVERLWRSVKYENIYLNHYEAALEAYQGLEAYFDFYNDERPHQSLDYQTPSEVYCLQEERQTSKKGASSVPVVAFLGVN